MNERVIMDDYYRLTKKTSVNGEEEVTCAFLDTARCDGQCALCPVMDAILKQLCAFEETFLEMPAAKE